MTEFDSTPRWTLADTAIGPCMVVVGPAGVRQIRLRASAPEKTAAKLHAVRDDEGLTAIVDALAGLIDGTRSEFPFPIDLEQGTPFQRAVWKELATLGRDETVTYGELADRVGRPNAARAIGGAVGANPLPVVVPCHRVLAAGGKLGGYTGGLDIKRHLLQVEGIPWK